MEVMFSGSHSVHHLLEQGFFPSHLSKLVFFYPLIYLDLVYHGVCKINELIEVGDTLLM